MDRITFDFKNETVIIENEKAVNKGIQKIAGLAGRKAAVYKAAGVELAEVDGMNNILGGLFKSLGLDVEED